MTVKSLLLASIVIVAVAPAAYAQNPPRPSPPSPPATTSAAADDDAPEIVVTGQRPRGSVPGDIQPTQVLSPADVRSYGVSSVGALIAELAPQTTSGRGGAPVILLSGRRISSFAEIRDLPTEAIARVDILPEEVALKYGYPATQKVVNIVLRERFRSFTSELGDGVATAGGRNTPSGQFGFLRIQKNGRLNIDLKYQDAAGLSEAQRGISAPAVAGSNLTDLAPFRSLLAATRQFSGNAVLARNLSDTVSATLNGRVQVDDSTRSNGRALLTLRQGGTTLFSYPDTVGALQQRAQTFAAHVGATANGTVGTSGWRWNAVANYDQTRGKTFSDTGLDIAGTQALVDAGLLDPTRPLTPAQTLLRATDLARSLARNADASVLLNGELATLPAGKVASSLKLGGQYDGFDSTALRAGVATSGHVSRTTLDAQGNVDVPIASRHRDVLGFAGELSANANARVRRLSDFGTLTTLGYGLNWTPVSGVNLLVSRSREDGAPTPQQLGNPLITTANAPVYDFIRGTNALVSRVDGGNAALAGFDVRAFRAGLTVKPFVDKELTLVAAYTSQRTRNLIGSLPSATAAIQAAFPDRFVRDAGGTLLRVDNRPVNFAQEDASQFRYGLTFSQPLKSKRPSPEQLRAVFDKLRASGVRLGGGGPGGDRGGGDRGGPPGGGAAAAGASGPGGAGRPGGFNGRGGGGPFGGGQGGRLQLAVFHTIHLTDRLNIRDGLPVYDRLNGAASGNGGGQPRHEVEVNAGWANNGIGARVSGDYQSATRVDSGTGGQLRFGALTTLNFRLFADLGRQLNLVKDHPWLIGTRVTFAIDNILDTRQQVTDGLGAVPQAYQPGYRDPLGRVVRVSVRKLFF